MSKHIADMIDLQPIPVFGADRTKTLKIPESIMKQIDLRNAQFNLQNQQHLAEKAAQQINQCFKERLNK